MHKYEDLKRDVGFVYYNTIWK